MIIIIVAVSENNVIGKNNELLWHLPHDFKRFKELTSGHYIVMGRKTFESLPKLLPNRTHIVISKQSNYQPENCIVTKNLEEAIKKCPTAEENFIIGGGEIYAQAMAYADKLEITRVHNNFDGDTFFPEINTAEWKLMNTEKQTKDEKHLYDFTFMTYIRVMPKCL